MNGLVDQPEILEEITVRLVFVGGDTFVQNLPMSHLEGVQDLMNWFRDTKSVPVWTWHVPSAQCLHMLNRAHIMGIDVEGYIEPDGQDSKWYQRIMDKIRTKWIMRKL